LDLLRLTRESDGQLLQAYQAAAEMKAWRTMRIETITRLVIPAIFGIVTVLVSPAIFTGMLYLLSPEGFLFLLVLVTLLVFVVRMLLLYIREPLLRMRVVTALSINIAALVPDTTTAIMIGSGVVALLRLIQIISLYALAAFTFNSFTSALNSYDAQWHMLLAAAWLWVLALGFMPAVRWGYARLRQWLQRRTVVAMRNSA
jgi:hypothetical protein